jgi:hypothetical protein
MLPIPSTEPSSVFAGDTITWQITIPDCPASSGWTLNYRLINTTGKIDIASNANVNDFLISVPAATSAAYVPGVYAWQSYLTDLSGNRFSIATGSIEIKPNWAGQAAGIDTRSNAKKILDSLEAAWVTAASTRAYVFEYKIENRMMRFATRGEWIAEMDYWRREVAREARAEKVAAGLDSGRKVYVRF